MDKVQPENQSERTPVCARPRFTAPPPMDKVRPETRSEHTPVCLQPSRAARVALPRAVALLVAEEHSLAHPRRSSVTRSVAQSVAH